MTKIIVTYEKKILNLINLWHKYYCKVG